MPGGHRRKLAWWRLPLAALVAIAALVGVGFWIVGGHPQPVQQTAAPESPAAAMTVAPPAPAQTPDEAPVAPAAPPTPPPATTTEAAPPPPPPAPTEPAVPAAVDLPTRSVEAFVPRPVCSTTLNGAQPHVAQVGNFLKMMFGITDVGAANGRAGDGDHGAGLALDLMMPNATLGDAVADYVLAHQQSFGVTYVIWQQRYNDGGGWSMMEDRGSPTQNHMDHVHVSFAPSTDVSLTC